MSHRHGSKSEARFYQTLEPFVRQELEQLIDAEFRRRHPGIAVGRKLDTTQNDQQGVKQWLDVRDELCGNFATGSFKRQPKTVVQKDTMLCWAAALESWLATVGGPKMTQVDLRAKYGTPPTGALDLTNIHNFDSVAKPLHINWEVKLGHDLTYSYFYNLLARRSQLLVIYVLGGGVSHTVVVFGINIQPNGKSALWIMDPSASGGAINISLQDLRSRALVLIGWKPGNPVP